MTAPETRAVIDALSGDGAAVRFVGGCVRDAALARPVTDIDIATPAPPETVIDLLERKGLRAIPTGLAHGTVTALAGARRYEITTLRRDIETDGRHAKVAFTDDWTADAARRDFTINAMSCDLDGKLYDPFDGLADLKAGRVRFVGEAAARIEEDALRLLRFFRFHAHYGTPPPDPEGLAACVAGAPKLAALSGERIREELLKLLAAPDPAPTVGVLIEHRILDHALPEPPRASATALLDALVKAEGAVGRGDRFRRLAALLVAATGDAGPIAERLRLSNEERSRLQALLRPPEAVAAAMDEAAARAALYRLGGGRFIDLALLAWARAGEAADGPRWRALIDLAARWQTPRLPVTGNDVLALGVEPGPAVGALLAAAERWWIDGDFQAGRDAVLTYLRELVSEQSAKP